MTAKRFRVNELVKYNYSEIGEYIDENHTDKPLRNDEVVKLLNELHEENEQLKDVNVQCCNDYSAMRRDVLRYKEENKQLKQLIKKLEKQIHLVHMSSMFSTVKSFKGDVSKRYKHSEETDTIYDTANNYGQYDKVLDKKEIVMLLNEYETVLNELKGDVE